MKYKLEVKVALTYKDKDIEVEVELSNEEVAKIKELVAKSIELQKGVLDEDEFIFERDLLMILESIAPELFDKFWDAIMPPVFVEVLINGFDNGYIEKHDDDEFDDYYKADFDVLYAMYGDEMELEHSSCCICKIPEKWMP